MFWITTKPLVKNVIFIITKCQYIENMTTSVFFLTFNFHVRIVGEKMLMMNSIITEWFWSARYDHWTRTGKKVKQVYMECPHLDLVGSVTYWSESLSLKTPRLFSCAIRTELCRRSLLLRYQTEAAFCSTLFYP